MVVCEFLDLLQEHQLTPLTLSCGIPVYNLYISRITKFFHFYGMKIIFTYQIK